MKVLRLDTSYVVSDGAETSNVCRLMPYVGVEAASSVTWGGPGAVWIERIIERVPENIFPHFRVRGEEFQLGSY